VSSLGGSNPVCLLLETLGSNRKGVFIGPKYAFLLGELVQNRKGLPSGSSNPMNGYTFCNSKNVFCVKEIVRVAVFCPRDFWGGFGTFLGGSNISMGSKIIDFMHKKGSIFIDFINNWSIGIISWPIQTLKKGQKMVFLRKVKKESKNRVFCTTAR
jgi:hypothetical protein